MIDIGDTTLSDQFEEVVGQVVRRLSQCTHDFSDETIYRRRSVTLTHIHQLAQLTDASITCQSESPPTSAALEPPPMSICLDPTDWTSVRALSHKMLDASLDFLEMARDRPAWLPLPTEVRGRLLCEPLPKHGKPMEEVCQDVLNDVVPYSGGNTHPRFWAGCMDQARWAVSLPR
ncbi:unnamed protein product [Sphagnum troendelagicum]|uniref:Uncharacterized protein n=1 Tax=Sphagnum troendelagicum TaxID=128251 RepID=A0ABP0T761_9BRYO